MTFEHFPNIRYAQLTDAEFSLMDRVGLSLNLIRKTTKMDRGWWVWCPFVFPEQLDELVVKYNLSIHRGYRVEKIQCANGNRFSRHLEVEVIATIQAGGVLQISEKEVVEVKDHLSYDDSYKAYANAVLKLLDKVLGYTALSEILLSVPVNQCYFPGVPE
jgi:hypothetical protein